MVTVSLYLPSGTNSKLDHKFMFMDDFQITLQI
jgi:hypothetical protein